MTGLQNKLKIQKSSNPNSSFTYKFMIQEWFPCKHEKITLKVTAESQNKARSISIFWSFTGLFYKIQKWKHIKFLKESWPSITWLQYDLQQTSGLMQTRVSHARSSTKFQDFCSFACWGIEFMQRWKHTFKNAPVTRKSAINRKKGHRFGHNL